MSVIEIIIRLLVVVVLAGFLCLKRRQRARRPSEECHPGPWTGTAIDTGMLQPAVKRVRRGYLRTGEPAHRGCHPKALLETARRGIARLPYFRDRETGPEERPESDGAEQQ